MTNDGRGDLVAERLARAGCTTAEIPDLANEATRLYELATKTHPRKVRTR